MFRLNLFLKYRRPKINQIHGSFDGRNRWHKRTLLTSKPFSNTLLQKYQLEENIDRAKEFRRFGVSFDFSDPSVNTLGKVLRRYMRRACRRGGQKNEGEAW